MTPDEFRVAARAFIERSIADGTACPSFGAIMPPAAIAHLVTRSGGDPGLGPLTKLAMTELDSRITAHAVDAAGAARMLDGPETEPFLYSPRMRVAGGTSEIQRDLIGERLLGLPREPLR